MRAGRADGQGDLAARAGALGQPSAALRPASQPRRAGPDDSAVPGDPAHRERPARRPGRDIGALDVRRERGPAPDRGERGLRAPGAGTARTPRRVRAERPGGLDDRGVRHGGHELQPGRRQVRTLGSDPRRGERGRGPHRGGVPHPLRVPHHRLPRGAADAEAVHRGSGGDDRCRGSG